MRRIRSAQRRPWDVGSCLTCVIALWVVLTAGRCGPSSERLRLAEGWVTDDGQDAEVPGESTTGLRLDVREAFVIPGPDPIESATVLGPGVVAFWSESTKRLRVANSAERTLSIHRIPPHVVGVRSDGRGGVEVITSEGVVHALGRFLGISSRAAVEGTVLTAVGTFEGWVALVGGGGADVASLVRIQGEDVVEMSGPFLAGSAVSLQGPEVDRWALSIAGGGVVVAQGTAPHEVVIVPPDRVARTPFRTTYTPTDRFQVGLQVSVIDIGAYFLQVMLEVPTVAHGGSCMIGKGDRWKSFTCHGR
jgi:hypothetical protein